MRRHTERLSCPRLSTQPRRAGMKARDLARNDNNNAGRWRRRRPSRIVPMNTSFTLHRWRISKNGIDNGTCGLDDAHSTLSVPATFRNENDVIRDTTRIQLATVSSTDEPRPKIHNRNSQVVYFTRVTPVECTYH